MRWRKEEKPLVEAEPNKKINNMRLERVVGIVLKGKEDIRKNKKGGHECALGGMLVSRKKQGQLRSTGC